VDISCKYEIVTPLMLGGANHAPEFRLASYAHMLRWWWRFLALGRFGTIERASYWEALLFGWHTKEFGRKRVSFRLLYLDETAHPDAWNNEAELKKWSGIHYLTAQGFSERKPATVKSFKTEARISKRALPKNVPDIAGDTTKYWCLAQTTLIDAIALIGLLGGLGARSRRGFGSLAVSELIEGDNTIIDGLPADVETYRKMIKTHLGSARHTEQPRYSALSDKFTSEICASHDNARELMNDIGWAFQIYRSWGQRDGNGGHVHNLNRDGQRNSIPAGTAKGRYAGTEKGWYKAKFVKDHDDFYAPNRHGYGTFPGGQFDNRAVFGLPHNYGKKDVGWNTVHGTSAHNRRASPLLFHFHQLADGQKVFVASVIPADFAPDDARLSVGGNVRAAQDFQNFQVGDNIDFSLLKDFATFLRDPDATGTGLGVPHTSFTVIP